MDLQAYTEKRDFAKTPEPNAGSSTNTDELVFVIQEHAASHLHYDFRLELDGVLKSWAIPKGPSLDPKIKHLAMMVEDHPLAYRKFEGSIPKGEYGGGTVIVWDEGTYEPIDRIEGKAAQEKRLSADLRSGSLKIKLRGQKLNGEFALVKTHGMGENGWLLIKHNDEFASLEDVTLQDRSVLSGMNLEEMANSYKQSVGSKPYAEKTPVTLKSSVTRTERAGLESPAPGTGLMEIIQPGLIKPMKPILVDAPFDDPDWLFEYKYDGYRAIAVVGPNTKLLSRNDISFEKYYPIVNVLNTLPHAVVLDGEIAVMEENGRTDFGALQNWSNEMDGTLVYYVFDVLWLDGRNLMGLPLDQRQGILKKILPDGDHSIIKRSEVHPANGRSLFAEAGRKGYEGIVAKKKNSLYKPDQLSRDWLKIEVAHRQEVVIGGFSRKKDTNKIFSALLIGVYEDEGLRFVGKVGTGFPVDTQAQLMKTFAPYLSGESPFIADSLSRQPWAKVAAGEDITWLKPELICEVNFAEITREGLFRQSSFKGMRVDKMPLDVRLEVAQDTRSTTNTEGTLPVSLLPGGPGPLSIAFDGRKQELTHLDKILWPGEGVTKRDLLNYYMLAAEYMLPHLVERPMSLNRFPEGINGPHFYQKDITGKVPGWATTYAHTTAKGEQHNYLVGGEISGLLWMAGQGCIEINPWLSRTGSPDCPDHCVIDLDPEDTNTFDQVIEAAETVKYITDALHIPAYPKTSGSTGIHIYIPLGNSYSFEQSQQLAKLIVSLVNRELPHTTTMERKTAARNGKIYLDFLQNRPEATIAGVYSLRPKAGATVSMPLHWDEVKPGLKMRDFTIFNAIDRVRETGDLFKEVLNEAIDLPLAIRNAGSLINAGHQ